MKVYTNGNLRDKESLNEVLEPGFLFGWGVFEPLRVYNGNIPFLDLHIKRLKKGLEILGIEPVNLDWEKTIKDLLKENSLKDAYIRITAYKKRKGTGLLIYADKFAYYTQDTYEKGFTSIISTYKRDANSLNCRVKSISYLQNRLSWHEAQKKGKSEALVLNQEGFLTGGSRSNLFIVKNNQIITPFLESGAFCGITRKVVLEILKDSNIEVKEGNLLKEDLFSCEEAFITSALMEVMPLVECEYKALGTGKPGKLTSKLLANYRKLL